MQLPLHVVKLSSAKRQLPYRYYSLPMCKPEKVVQDGENMGQILSGARVENSDYKVRFRRHCCWRKATHMLNMCLQMFMRHNEFCNVLCAKTWSKQDAEQVADFINSDYLVHLYVSQVPQFLTILLMPASQGNGQPASNGSPVQPRES